MDEKRVKMWRNRILEKEEDAEKGVTVTRGMKKAKEVEQQEWGKRG